MTKKTSDKPTGLARQYEEALVASGLVHGVDEPGRLKPILRHILAREALCVPGDEADRLWVVVKGTFSVRLNEETLVTRSANAVVGEHELIDDVGRRFALVRAEHDAAEVLEIRKSAMDAHPQAHRIWRNCAWITSRKLEEATNTISAQRAELAGLYRLLRLHVGEHALSEEKLAPSSVVNGPRSEIAVVWFSDIVGFSKYAASISPYQAANFVQQFLTPQVEAIDQRRGFIDKFIGDAVMAYWVVTSRRAREECAAGLAAAFEVAGILRRIPLGASTMQIRIGLHVGRVSIGNFGTRMRSQFTLIGAEVNKASRLESADESQVTSGGPLGSIRASDEFFAALGANAKASLAVRATINAKNIGEVSLHTNSA